MTVSDADNGVVVNRSRKRIFTEANKGNEDGVKEVRIGLLPPQRNRVLQPKIAGHELPWEGDVNRKSTPTG